MTGEGTILVRTVLAAFALYLVASPSHAQDLDVTSGNFFFPICKDAFSATRPESALDTYGYGNCVGILDTLMMLGPNLEARHRFCPPSGASAKDAYDVSVAYLKARPESLRQNFTPLVATALAQAWPCK